jgi:hypothetical protein
LGVAELRVDLFEGDDIFAAAISNYWSGRVVAVGVEERGVKLLTTGEVQ